MRPLRADEIGQIAGRAGRYMNDGTFGVTGECEPFEDELVQRVETHRYDPVRVLQWRNAALDFRSLAAPERKPGCAAAGTRPDAGAARQRCGGAEDPVRTMTRSRRWPPRATRWRGCGMSASCRTSASSPPTNMSGWCKNIFLFLSQGRRHSRRLAGAPDRPRRCRRRRCRHPVGAAGADPHLHLCRPSPGLDARRRALAGHHPRRGRPAVGCAA